MINAIVWTFALAAADLKPQVTGGTQALPVAGPASAHPPPVAVPGQPTIFPALQQQQAAQQQAQQQKQAEKDAKNQQAQQMIQQMLMMMGGGNAPSRGDRVPEDTDYSKWEYPDSFKFQSGKRGAGNIGNGLCTSKNANRTQMKEGYCMELARLLGDRNTCAGRAMATIDQNFAHIKDLNQWCPNIAQMPPGKERQNVFMQVLATLIVQESGWRAGVKEDAWRTASGAKREGKGLFQIGEWDHKQDADCADINLSTIYDPKINMKCGACIALKNVAQDSAMGSGSNDDGSIGMARYFGPLREAQSDKRAAMQGAVKEYCLSSRSGGNAPAGSTDTSR